MMAQQMAIQQQLLSVQQQHLLNLQRQGLLSVPSALTSALPQGNNTSLPHDMKLCYQNVHPKGSGSHQVAVLLLLVGIPVQIMPFIPINFVASPRVFVTHVSSKNILFMKES